MKKYTANSDTVISYLKETFHRRSLILTLARRDVKVKYAQSVLGIGWVLLQPLTGALVFTFFFTQLFSFNSGIEVPYHLFSFSGYLCWLLFSQIINLAGTSLLNEENLIKKVYFPRIIIPISKGLVLVLDFAIGLLALLALSVFHDWHVLYRFVFTIPAVVLIIINSFAVAVWLSALTIRFRDLHHIIPYLISFGIWLTPVFFPSIFFPEKFRWMLSLNPLAFDIELFRSLLFNLELPSINIYVIIVHFVMFIMLVLGLKYFLKIDRLSSDYL